MAIYFFYLLLNITPPVALFSFGNIFGDPVVNSDSLSPHGCNNFGVCGVSIPYVAPIINCVNCICNKGTTGDKCETKLNMCEANSCQLPKKCNQSETIGKVDCYCENGNTDDRCELDITTICGKLGNPCAPNGNCTDAANRNPPFECKCKQGYIGTFCDVRDTCLNNNDCLNGGTCVMAFDKFESCKCPSSHTGKHCEHERTEKTITHPPATCINVTSVDPTLCTGQCDTAESCSPDLIRNSSMCCELPFKFPDSNIMQNYTLESCVKDNSTECVDKPSLFVYRQPSTVDTKSDTDDCNARPCGAGQIGVCVDLHLAKDGNPYNCICNPKYKKTFPVSTISCNSLVSNPCEVVNGTRTESYCKNGGSCVVLSGNNPKCLCRDGYLGTKCDNRNKCDSKPCKNGALCQESSIDDGYICECLTHYRGKHCEEVNICEYANPCQNNGTCNYIAVNATANVNYNCSCHLQHKGFNCEIERDVCFDFPGICMYNGTCSRVPGGYQCACSIGSTGTNCSDLIPHCVPKPLESGLNIANPCVQKDTAAICENILNDYKCICSDKWASRDCDIDAAVYEALQMLCEDDKECREKSNNMLSEIATNPGTAPNIVNYLVGSLNSTERRSLSWDKEETIVWASYEEKPLNIETDITQWNDVVLGNCFTLNSINSNITFWLRTSGARGAFRILLNVTNDYPPWIETRGMQIFTHNRNEAIFSESVRYNAAPNSEVHLKIRTARYPKLRNLLYGKCVSNVDEVKSYYYVGDYSTEGCRRACYQDAVHRDCGCMDPRYPKAKSVSPCTLPKMECVDSVLANTSSWEVGCDCPLGCDGQQFFLQWSRVEYLFNEDSSLNGTYDANSTFSDGSVADLVEVSVSLPFLDYVIFEEVPAMDLQKLLSYLGGFLVVLLGGSIYFIIDVVFILFKCTFIVIFFKKK